MVTPVPTAHEPFFARFHERRGAATDANTVSGRVEATRHVMRAHTSSNTPHENSASRANERGLKRPQMRVYILGIYRIGNGGGRRPRGRVRGAARRRRQTAGSSKHGITWFVCDV